MTTLLVHLKLRARHQGQDTVVDGMHFKYCTHRSHRSRLWCWRFSDYDGYCARHNQSCYSSCPEKP